MSASVTHELTQPLSAIGNNASVAGALLEVTSRDLFTRSTSDAQVVDLNEVVPEVFGLLSAHAFEHRATLHGRLFVRPVSVIGDRVQLQQVVLDLVMNGVDAIASAGRTEREITGHTFSDGSSGEVSTMGMGLAIARSIVVSQGAYLGVAIFRSASLLAAPVSGR